ncbi:MAG: galactokinase [Lachnospiraceae bacterium]|nr:galactokinase [Lachnospiraceae bacterium]
MTETKTLIREIVEGRYDERLADIYCDGSRVDREKKRLASAITEFVSLFGPDEPVEIYSAPGRSEIGGNHTDHQHGEVLAASISDDAIAVVSATEDGEVKLLSKGYDMITLSANDLALNPSEEGTTVALIRGVIAGMKERGCKVGGFHAFVTSDVLSGSGLSSSAAFETVIGNILSGLYNDNSVSAETIAMIGQYAENTYFGKPCGLMDQMACSVGNLCYIDFEDPLHPKTEKIEMDLDKAGYCLCITDTKGSHADLTADYAAVPREMKAVASLFGKEVLRFVPEEEVIANASMIREKCGDRALLRALHFYEENRRVRREADAIKAGDIPAFLRTVSESGNSSFKYLQNVYTNQDVAHQNVSVALMLSEKVLGENGVCRVHGGGFAGTIQAFVRKEAVDTYRDQMHALFGEDACHVLGIRKYGGIKVL